VKSWVEEWKSYVAGEISFDDKEISEKENKKCDINRDKKCNLPDFSILL